MIDRHTLAEAIHTGFRKGCTNSDCGQQIHGLITAMPDDEWVDYINWVHSVITDHDGQQK